jgi:hypothetical protein
MGDDELRGGTLEDAAQAALEGHAIQGRKTEADRECHRAPKAQRRPPVHVARQHGGGQTRRQDRQHLRHLHPGQQRAPRQ